MHRPDRLREGLFTALSGSQRPSAQEKCSQARPIYSIVVLSFSLVRGTVQRELHSFDLLNPVQYLKSIQIQNRTKFKTERFSNEQFSRRTIFKIEQI
jgi:hypothetical protein